MRYTQGITSKTTPEHLALDRFCAFIIFLAIVAVVCSEVL